VGEPFRLSGLIPPLLRRYRKNRRGIARRRQPVWLSQTESLLCVFDSHQARAGSIWKVTIHHQGCHSALNMASNDHCGA
jgi:hypothetical protein